MATKTQPQPADGSGLQMALNAAGSQYVSLSQFCCFIERWPNNSSQIRFCTLISENQNDESACHTAFQILLLSLTLTCLWGKNNVLILRGGKMKIREFLQVTQWEKQKVPFDLSAAMGLSWESVSSHSVSVICWKGNYHSGKMYSYHVLINEQRQVFPQKFASEYLHLEKPKEITDSHSFNQIMGGCLHWQSARSV